MNVIIMSIILIMNIIWFNNEKGQGSIHFLFETCIQVLFTAITISIWIVFVLTDRNLHPVQARPLLRFSVFDFEQATSTLQIDAWDDLVSYYN